MSRNAQFAFRVRQEEDRVPSRTIVVTTLVAIGTAAMAMIASSLLLVAVSGGLRPDEAGPGGPRPGPRTLAGLEQTPILAAEVGLDLHNAQRRELQAWGWADRDAGLARIPIDRAIDLVVSESPR